MTQNSDRRRSGSPLSNDLLAGFSEYSKSKKGRGRVNSVRDSEEARRNRRREVFNTGYTLVDSISRHLLSRGSHQIANRDVSIRGENIHHRLDTQDPI